MSIETRQYVPIVEYGTYSENKTQIKQASVDLEAFSCLLIIIEMCYLSCEGKFHQHSHKIVDPGCYQTE